MVELNFRKTKWLLFGTYHPHNQNNTYFFEKLDTASEVYFGKYEKFLLAGDFNIEEKETALSDFLSIYNLKNLVNDKTCFKSLSNPTTIDLLQIPANPFKICVLYQLVYLIFIIWLSLFWKPRLQKLNLRW